VMGDAGPTADVVFYEDGDAGTRATDLLDDAGVDSAMYQVFTLNVEVNESQYGTSDVILQALRDVCDAEFPGLASVYVDRFGRVAVHGRLARFTPDDIADDAGAEAWDFTRWAGATAPDVAAGKAQIREFGFNRPRSRIINTYTAWPRADELGKTWKRSGMAAQISTDSASIAAYGYRGRDATDLIIKRLKPSVGTSTGKQQCRLYADFYVDNYRVPRKNIQTVRFTSLRPFDDRAADVWDLLTRIDISDILALTVAQEGLSAEEFFVEGVQVSCRRTTISDVDLVSVTPNLSPQAYYTSNPFG